MRLGTTEIILIVVLALVLFGGSKLAGVGKALGKSIKDFKNEVRDDKDEKPVTMVAELSAKELKVTSIEGDDEAVESFKSVLPMVFSK